MLALPPVVALPVLPVVALLLAHTGIDVNQKTNEGRSPLCVASGNGDAEVVALLLSHPNINVNA